MMSLACVACSTGMMEHATRNWTIVDTMCGRRLSVVRIVSKDVVNRMLQRKQVRMAAGDDVGRLNSGVKESVFQELADAVKTTSRGMHDEATGMQKNADVVRTVLDELRQAGTVRRWNSLASISCRTTFVRELSTLGIKNAENLGKPSSRNDLAFLATVVGSTSLIAVLAGQLPGDWGFFVPYLVGSISLVVLAIGSVAPGLLQASINGFSSFFPDYQERILRHEAAHFLIAYLAGVPIIGYSLDIGREHVNLADETLQKRIYEGFLDVNELNRLAVVSMAGLAAEGLKYDKVVGQSADLFSLQRLMVRSKPPLSNQQQQNLTRWAALYAGSVLKNNEKVYEALMSAMKRKGSISDCVQAIENV